jgi:hypothetical protein
VDADRRLREPRSGVRHLRDISHLYLSSPRGSGRFEAAPQPAPRRLLRIALAGPGAAAARSAVGANLAVQFARLGRRTLVIDLDPALPGIGFRLGLAPAQALAHVAPGDGAGLGRGVFGIRVLCGVAGNAEWEVQVAPLLPALRTCECVILQLPATVEPQSLQALARLFPAPPATSTLARAAARSPMIGAWLASAQRPVPVESAVPATRIDVALWVVDAGLRHAEPPADLVQALEEIPRRVLYGLDAHPSPGDGMWAHLPLHGSPGWMPMSALDPEAPEARRYEGFAQAVLAASARPGGAAHA